MKNLLVLLALSFALFSLSAQASETDISLQPTYNSGSDWWVEVTPEDPDYALYKVVELNCFCD